MLHGIDISSHQTGIDLRSVPCAFVIIKATQGTSYVNPDLKRSYNQARTLGKLIGLYHYASKGGSTAEANHFINTINSLGARNCILVLDWEKGDNANWGNVAYAKAFLDRVKYLTGITPFIYMSKNVCREYDWSSVAPTYPLWVAQYKNYIPTGYQEEPWTDNKGYGAWEKPLIYQYSSVGQLSGWHGNLDLDASYIEFAEWNEWSTPGKKTLNPKNQKGKYTIDTSDYPTVRKGNKNEWVRLLQQALGVYGYTLSADGVFGSLTLYAVKDFQMKYGLQPDGVVGPLTWRKLFP